MCHRNAGIMDLKGGSWERPAVTIISSKRFEEGTIIPIFLKSFREVILKTAWAMMVKAHSEVGYQHRIASRRHHYMRICCLLA